MPLLLVTIDVYAKSRVSSQLFANCSCGFSGTSSLQAYNLDQVDDPAHVVGFILFARQAIYLHRDCRKRLLLPVEMVFQHIVCSIEGDQDEIKDRTQFATNCCRSLLHLRTLLYLVRVMTLSFPLRI